MESHSRVIRTANAVTAVELRSDWVDSFAPANGRNVAGGFAFGKCKGGKLKPAFKRAVPQAFGLSPF